jgi:hypothetical protein
MKSRIAGQIHDSIIGDVHADELSDYLDLVKRVMTQDIKKDYDWLIVPLDIENEICPPNGSWFDKSVVEFADGKYSLTPKGEDSPIHFRSSKEYLAYQSEQLTASKQKK